jgi:hypothetical protein
MYLINLINDKIQFIIQYLIICSNCHKKYMVINFQNNYNKKIYPNIKNLYLGPLICCSCL